jgi:hypothetical protein
MLSVETDPFAPAAGHPSPAAGSSPERAGSPGPASAKEILAGLDQRYLELIQQPPEAWELDTLVLDCQALRSRADDSQRLQIDERLAALESRRQVWSEYKEFLRLTSETSQRDAELVAISLGAQGALPPSPPVQPGATRVVPVPSGGETPTPVPGGELPGFAPPAPDAPAVETSATSTGVMTPNLSGAGIVRRMPSGLRGQPVYVLTDPPGRVLAVLQGDPRVLEAQVGRSIGVIGQRYFDPRLRSDVVNVRQILPVQLAR